MNFSQVATRLVQKYVVRNRACLSSGAGRCLSSKLGSQGGFRVAEIFAERKGPALGHNGAGPGKDYLPWAASLAKKLDERGVTLPGFAMGTPRTSGRLSLRQRAERSNLVGTFLWVAHGAVSDVTGQVFVS